MSQGSERAKVLQTLTLDEGGLEQLDGWKGTPHGRVTTSLFSVSAKVTNNNVAIKTYSLAAVLDKMRLRLYATGRHEFIQGITFLELVLREQYKRGEVDALPAAVAIAAGGGTETFTRDIFVNHADPFAADPRDTEVGSGEYRHNWTGEVTLDPVPDDSGAVIAGNTVEVSISHIVVEAPGFTGRLNVETKTRVLRPATGEQRIDLPKGTRYRLLLAVCRSTAAAVTGLSLERDGQTITGPLKLGQLANVLQSDRHASALADPLDITTLTGAADAAVYPIIVPGRGFSWRELEAGDLSIVLDGGAFPAGTTLLLEEEVPRTDQRIQVRTGLRADIVKRAMELAVDRFPGKWEGKSMTDLVDAEPSLPLRLRTGAAISRALGNGRLQPDEVDAVTSSLRKLGVVG